MARHQLKTDILVWDALFDGLKTAEFRKNDRDFKVGDHLELLGWTGEEYTGYWVDRWVTHIVHGPAYGIPVGYCMLSLANEKPDRQEEEEA